MRRKGKTFRLILGAIYNASVNDSKAGVYVYTHNNHYSKQLLKEAIDIITSYIPKEDIIVKYHNRSVTLPNKKSIYFRTIAEKNTIEKRKGIDWGIYDEMVDQ